MRGEKTVNIKSIKNNLNSVKSKTGVKVICVIKADAYGHGAYKVAKCLDNDDGYAVATTEEALEVKEAVKGRREVLILGKVEPSEYAELIKNKATLTLDSEEELTLLNREAEKLNECAYAHIAVNTGMNRIGVKYYKPLYKLINSTNSLKNVCITGIFSHLYSSVSEIKDVQKERFIFAVSGVEKSKNLTVHLGATSAVGDKSLYFDALRLGIGLYGYCADGVVPSMEVKGKVVAVNYLSAGETVGYNFGYVSKGNEYSATVSLGYADGVPRAFTGGDVLIGGKRRKIVGNICMDACFAIVDEKVKVGDEVVFIGKQGNEILTADDMAKTLKTIPYEVLIGFKRIKTSYKE